MVALVLVTVLVLVLALALVHVLIRVLVPVPLCTQNTLRSPCLNPGRGAWDARPRTRSLIDEVTSTEVKSVETI